MGTFIVNDIDKIKVEIEGGKSRKLLKKEKFDSFIPNVSGLGEIGKKSVPINALAAIFDLQGFTNFCRQIDPHLAVPEYLQLFLDWLFKKIREGIKIGEVGTGVSMYSDLPFFSKFLGDGVLFIWNTDTMSEIAICNIIALSRNICLGYRKDFLLNIGDKIIDPPNDLRCGISRGIVYSVGNGQDFVGPCINMASRLQKLSQLTFSFSRRGINYTEFMDPQTSLEYIVKKVSIRGIGNEELVCVLKSEFTKLSDGEKENFKKP